MHCLMISDKTNNVFVRNKCRNVAIFEWYWYMWSIFITCLTPFLMDLNCFVLQINAVICKDIWNALCVDLWQILFCIIWFQFSYRQWSCKTDSNNLYDVTFLSPASPPALHSSSHNSYPFFLLVCASYMHGPLEKLTINTPKSSLRIHTSCSSRGPLYMWMFVDSLHIVHDLCTRCAKNMNSVNVQGYGLLGQSSLRCVYQGDLCNVQDCGLLNRDYYANSRCVIQASTVNVWDCGLFSAEFRLHAHAV